MFMRYFSTVGLYNSANIYLAMTSNATIRLFATAALIVKKLFISEYNDQVMYLNIIQRPTKSFCKPNYLSAARKIML